LTQAALLTASCGPQMVPSHYQISIPRAPSAPQSSALRAPPLSSSTRREQSLETTMTQTAAFTASCGPLAVPSPPSILRVPRAHKPIPWPSTRRERSRVPTLTQAPVPFRASCGPPTELSPSSIPRAPYYHPPHYSPKLRPSTRREQSRDGIFRTFTPARFTASCGHPTVTSSPSIPRLPSPLGHLPLRHQPGGDDHGKLFCKQPVPRLPAGPWRCLHRLRSSGLH
jgi:hypothetical protein